MLLIVPITSARKGIRESELGEPYILEFTISEATCARIFDLARQANYFKGKFSSVNGPLVNASVTTLTYREGPPFSYEDLITNVVDNTPPTASRKSSPPGTRTYFRRYLQHT